MEKLTASVKPEHLYELEARQRLGKADSRSAALRQILDEYQELRSDYESKEAEYAELKQRYEERENRISDLEEQLQKRSQIEEEISALPDKIRSVGTYGERRQRLLDQATLAQRLKWKVTGVPVGEIETEGEGQGP